MRGCAAVALPTVASREPVSRCCTVRNCRTPSLQPCGCTTRPHTQAVRKQTLIAGAMSSCEQHHSLFTIASSSPPFLARPSLSPTHRHFLSLPLLVTAASRHRRFSSTLSGAAPSSPSRLLLRRAHSPASRATPTAQRRGEGSARERHRPKKSECHVTRLGGRQNQRNWGGCQLVLAPGFIFWNAVSSPPRGFR